MTMGSSWRLSSISVSNACATVTHTVLYIFSVSCVISPHAWFSKKLYQHMAVDDEVLLEILITRKNVSWITVRL